MVARFDLLSKEGSLMVARFDLL